MSTLGCQAIPKVCWYYLTACKISTNIHRASTILHLTKSNNPFHAANCAPLFHNVAIRNQYSRDMLEQNVRNAIQQHTRSRLRYNSAEAEIGAVLFFLSKQSPFRWMHTQSAHTIVFVGSHDAHNRTWCCKVVYFHHTYHARASNKSNFSKHKTDRTTPLALGNGPTRSNYFIKSPRDLWTVNHINKCIEATVCMFAHSEHNL